MKHIPTVFAIILILSLALFGLSGCKELKELKASLVESVGVNGLGAYGDKVLVMFVYKTDRDFWFNVFNFKTSEYICFGTENPGENRTGIAYYVSHTQFVDCAWDEEQGLMSTFSPWGGETTYVTKKDFWELVSPMVVKLLEQKKSIMDTMREVALDLGLIESHGI